MEPHASKVRQAFLPVDVPMYDRHSCLSPLQSTTGIPACRLSPPTFATPDSNTPLQISRRHLPHWHLNGAIYWVCFRLADAIPQDKLRAWKEELALWRQANPEPWDDRQWQEYDRRFGERYHAWLDAGMGSRALARPDVRQVVADCLLRFDGERLQIHAAVIMPTHVHALMEPLPVAGREGTGRIPWRSRQARMPVIPWRMPVPPCVATTYPICCTASRAPARGRRTGSLERRVRPSGWTRPTTISSAARGNTATFYATSTRTLSRPPCTTGSSGCACPMHSVPKVGQAFLPARFQPYSKETTRFPESALDPTYVQSYDAPIATEVVFCRTVLTCLGAAWDWSLVFNPIPSTHPSRPAPASLFLAARAPFRYFFTVPHMKSPGHFFNIRHRQQPPGLIFSMLSNYS